MFSDGYCCGNPPHEKVLPPRKVTRWCNDGPEARDSSAVSALFGVEVGTTTGRTRADSTDKRLMDVEAGRMKPRSIRCHERIKVNQ